MTQPNPDEKPPADNKPPAVKTAPPVDLLTVGHFVHRDRILGGDHDRHGVVVAVDGNQLEVYPLERYTVKIDAAEFYPLKPDDLA